MQEIGIRLKTSWWPSPQDYNEAIQNPHLNMEDEELRTATVYLDSNGIPRPVTGAFASVYRFKCQHRDIALRCFLKSIPDQEERYSLVSHFVQECNLPYTVTFDFLTSGIRAAGEWTPALKMEWVDGLTLDSYILANLKDTEKLNRLSVNFRKMMDDLRSVGIAHGDLQHANIMVLLNGELRLVDYDGMYVPTMNGLFGNELGHVNYQHPRRHGAHFGHYLDNFSSWNIYASMVALQVDPQLWPRLGAGDDCLLFRKSDFINPLESPAFAAFENHSHEELRALGRFIRSQLACDPADVPYLQTPVPVVMDLEVLADQLPVTRSPVRVRPGDWFEWSDSVGNEDDEQALPFSSKIESELQVALPRKVKYNRAHRTPSPANLTALMLINPLTWFFLGYLGQAAFDTTLCIGMTVDGRVTQVSNFTDKTGNHTSVDCSYWQNNYWCRGYRQKALVIDPPESKDHEIKEGENIKAFVQDSSPLFTDLIISLFCLFGVVSCEWLILSSARRHRRLAQNGAVALGEIHGKIVRGRDRRSYSLNVVCSAGKGASHCVSIPVNEAEYRQSVEGELVSVLYNPSNPDDAILYRTCRYQVVKQA